MEKEFVTYDIALRMKALGLDEPCFGIFINGKFNLIFSQHQLDTIVLAPTWQSAFAWFREKYGWIAEIHGSLMQNHFYANLLYQAKGEVNNIKMCETYEEAQQTCLEKLCEIVENQKTQ